MLAALGLSQQWLDHVAKRQKKEAEWGCQRCYATQQVLLSLGRLRLLLWNCPRR